MANNFNDVDVLLNKILASLQALKSKKLKGLHMQDFNVDLLKIERKKDNVKQNTTPGFEKFSVAMSEEFGYGIKPNLSKWKLKRRARKIFKLQKKVEHGYINAIEKCIEVVEKEYKEFLK